MRQYNLISLYNWLPIALTGGGDEETRPKFVVGLLNLISDSTGYIIGASIGIAVLFGAWFAIKWYTASENEKEPAMKRLKNVGVGAVIVVSLEGIITWVLSYFI